MPKFLQHSQWQLCLSVSISIIIILCIIVINSFHVTQYSLHTDITSKDNKNKNRRILLQKSSLTNTEITEKLHKLIEGTYDDVHIVVTTGCSGYQNWQFETLIYSWAKIKQPGRFTRIIAGCKTEKEKFNANTTAIPNDDQRILFYFVKDFSPDKDDKNNGGRPFWYFNKPFGFNQWLNDPKNIIYESVIILIDPDMIILKPFLFHIKSEADKIAKQLSLTTPEKKNNKARIRDLYVRRGHPVSQKYGIGAKWVRGNWTGFCDGINYNNTDCQSKNERYIWEYYSVGPPYMMHIDDWKLISDKWVKFSPLALKWDPPPSILAEMYSYVIACAIYNLKHEYLLSMVSSPDSNKYMENTFDIDLYKTDHGQFKFHILHYCHGYWLGEKRNTGTIRNGGWNFHKGHIPTEFLYNCDIPLLVEITDDEDFSIYKERDQSKIEGQYGMVWVLKVLISRINEAVLNYRVKYCNNTFEPSYKLVLQQPEADKNGRRMNYILNDYDGGKSWKGA